MLALCYSCLLLAATPADLLVYHPFDGSTTPAWAAQPEATSAGPLTFADGRQGPAVRLAADLRLRAAGNFNPTTGTLAVWVAFDESGSLPASRYLACVYGAGNDGWQHSRFSLYAAGGQMQFAIWGDDARQRSIAAPIADWPAGSWHHVAITGPGSTEVVRAS